jgi:hypothetical protein
MEWGACRAVRTAGLAPLLQFPDLYSDLRFSVRHFNLETSDRVGRHPRRMHPWLSKSKLPRQSSAL